MIVGLSFYLVSWIIVGKVVFVQTFLMHSEIPIGGKRENFFMIQYALSEFRKYEKKIINANLNMKKKLKIFELFN